MKQLVAFGIAVSLFISNINISPVQASCYSYKGSRQERIKLQDKKNGYIRVWATQDLKGQMVGRLRHGEVVTTLKFIESPVCGGSIYIKFRNSQGKIAYGWVFSDTFIYATE